METVEGHNLGFEALARVRDGSLIPCVSSTHANTLA